MAERPRAAKESQHTEWKESWRDDHLRWICGFANAEGGVLVIGRDDKGQVVGIPDAARLLEELPNKVRDLLGIMVEVNLRKIGGREYLEIVVPPYPAAISYRGHYYQRSGSTLQELKAAALDHFILRKQGRAWDGVPVPDVLPRALSKPAVDSFRDQARRSERMDAADLREKPDGLMEKLHLWDGKYLKRAAVLAFHPDPERFVTGAFVKVGFFRTNDDLRYHDEIHGPLVTQVDRVVETLHAKYLKAGISYAGIQRVETYPVPEPALREALLNAVLHKDYAVGAPIQISVYDDKMMIWNPAQLPSGWTVAKLKKKHASHPFNPDLANVFFRAGEVEAWGRGIERMCQACRDAGSQEPAISFDQTGLWVSFEFSKAYRELIEKPVGGAAGRGTDEVTTEVTTEVGLLQVMTTETSRKALQAALGLKNSEHFRKTYLLPALERGLIEMTIPDKPNSRLQKYRITSAGRALLQAAKPKVGSR
jgi:ATP-dependent DNA helicase RecG